MRHTGRIAQVLWGGLVMCGFGAIALLTANASDLCRDPDPNTKACYTPTQAVATCVGISQQFCTSSKLYEIKQFPKKDIEGFALLHEPQRDCYKFASCVWDAEHNPPCCVAPKPEAWSPIYQLPKIEVKAECPWEE